MKRTLKKVCAVLFALAGIFFFAACVDPIMGNFGSTREGWPDASDPNFWDNYGLKDFVKPAGATDVRHTFDGQNINITFKGPSTLENYLAEEYFKTWTIYESETGGRPSYARGVTYVSMNVTPEGYELYIEKEPDINDLPLGKLQRVQLADFESRLKTIVAKYPGITKKSHYFEVIPNPTDKAKPMIRVSIRMYGEFDAAKAFRQEVDAALLGEDTHANLERVWKLDSENQPIVGQDSIPDVYSYTDGTITVNFDTRNHPYFYGIEIDFELPVGKFGWPSDQELREHGLYDFTTQSALAIDWNTSTYQIIEEGTQINEDGSSNTEDILVLSFYGLKDSDVNIETELKTKYFEGKPTTWSIPPDDPLAGPPSATRFKYQRGLAYVEFDTTYKAFYEIAVYKNPNAQTTWPTTEDLETHGIADWTSDIQPQSTENLVYLTAPAKADDPDTTTVDETEPQSLTLWFFGRDGKAITGSPSVNSYMAFNQDTQDTHGLTGWRPEIVYKENTEPAEVDTATTRQEYSRGLFSASLEKAFAPFYTLSITKSTDPTLKTKWPNVYEWSSGLKVVPNTPAGGTAPAPYPIASEYWLAATTDSEIGLNMEDNYVTSQITVASTDANNKTIPDSLSLRFYWDKSPAEVEAKFFDTTWIDYVPDAVKENDPFGNPIDEKYFNKGYFDATLNSTYAPHYEILLTFNPSASVNWPKEWLAQYGGIRDHRHDKDYWGKAPTGAKLITHNGTRDGSTYTTTGTTEVDMPDGSKELANCLTISFNGSEDTITDLITNYFDRTWYREYISPGSDNNLATIVDNSYTFNRNGYTAYLAPTEASPGYFELTLYKDPRFTDTCGWPGGKVTEWSKLFIPNNLVNAIDETQWVNAPAITTPTDTDYYVTYTIVGNDNPNPDDPTTTEDESLDRSVSIRMHLEGNKLLSEVEGIFKEDSWVKQADQSVANVNSVFSRGMFNYAITKAADSDYFDIVISKESFLPYVDGMAPFADWTTDLLSPKTAYPINAANNPAWLTWPANTGKHHEVYYISVDENNQTSYTYRFYLNSPGLATVDSVANHYFQNWSLEKVTVPTQADPRTTREYSRGKLYAVLDVTNAPTYEINLSFDTTETVNEADPDFHAHPVEWNFPSTWGVEKRRVEEWDNLITTANFPTWTVTRDTLTNSTESLNVKFYWNHSTDPATNLANAQAAFFGTWRLDEVGEPTFYDTNNNGVIDEDEKTSSTTTWSYSRDNYVAYFTATDVVTPPQDTINDFRTYYEISLQESSELRTEGWPDMADWNGLDAVWKTALPAENHVTWSGTDTSADPDKGTGPSRSRTMTFYIEGGVQAAKNKFFASSSWNAITTDPNGDPVYEYDVNGNQVYDENGDPKVIPELKAYDYVSKSGAFTGSITVTMRGPDYTQELSPNYVELSVTMDETYASGWPTSAKLAEYGATTTAWSQFPTGISGSNAVAVTETDDPASGTTTLTINFTSQTAITSLTTGAYFDDWFAVSPAYYPGTSEYKKGPYTAVVYANIYEDQLNQTGPLPGMMIELTKPTGFTSNWTTWPGWPTAPEADYLLSPVSNSFGATNIVYNTTPEGGFVLYFQAGSDAVSLDGLFSAASLWLKKPVEGNVVLDYSRGKWEAGMERKQNGSTYCYQLEINQKSHPQAGWPGAGVTWTWTDENKELHENQPVWDNFPNAEPMAAPNGMTSVGYQRSSEGNLVIWFFGTTGGSATAPTAGTTLYDLTTGSVWAKISAPGDEGVSPTLPWLYEYMYKGAKAEITMTTINGSTNAYFEIVISQNGASAAWPQTQLNSMSSSLSTLAPGNGTYPFNPTYIVVAESDSTSLKINFWGDADTQAAVTAILRSLATPDDSEAIKETGTMYSYLIGNNSSPEVTLDISSATPEKGYFFSLTVSK